MKENTAHIASKIITNSFRFVLALVFTFSGLVKAIDPMGTVYKMADYAEAFGMTIHSGLLLSGAILLIIVEYVVGVCLFFGLYRKLYLSITIAFLAVMTPFTLYIALYNPVSNCGCFGDAIALTNWQTFAKNVILLLMACFTFANSKRICRVISIRLQWLIFVYAMVSIVAFIPYNLRHLPVIDFRPFHIGANIVKDMIVPDDATQDEYETLFILEKEGKRKTFTFDNYPDSTWTFVARESRLISKGYVPPISDFHLTDLEGKDCTWEILEQPGYTFLMIAHNLEQTNEGMLDIINDLYDYAKVGEYPFYMLTASNRKAIEEWTDHTGASYPYLQAAESLLKTMIRSNLGLILLKEATIVNKWSAADMPHDTQLTNMIEHNTTLLTTRRHIADRIARIALWLFLPLMLLVAIDRSIYQKNRE